MDDNRAVALIRSRCDGALTAVELDEIEAAIRQRPAPILLDADVAEKLTTVLDALEDRLAGMIERVDAQRIAEAREAAFIDAADINTTWN